MRLGNVDEPTFTNDDGSFSAIRYTAREVAEGEGARGPNADLVFEVTAPEDQNPRGIAAILRRFAVGDAVTEQRVAGLVAGFSAAASFRTLRDAQANRAWLNTRA